jgi:hypothetical protein
VKFKINAGVDIETATPAEVAGMLDSSQQSWFAEMARGVKHFRFGFTGAVTTGAVDISSAQQGGPNQGFVWAVQRLSVDSLGTGDTLRVYRAPVQQNTFYGLLTATSPEIHFGSKGMILHGGEELEITGTGLTTTATNLTVSGEAIELPEFMLWKFL